MRISPYLAVPAVRGCWGRWREQKCEGIRKFARANSVCGVYRKSAEVAADLFVHDCGLLLLGIMHGTMQMAPRAMPCPDFGKVMDPKENEEMTLSDQHSTRPDLDHMRPDDAEPDVLDQIGTTIDDRYEILSMLGRGGMSVVYKAHHKLLDRTVAVKMLLKGSVASQESLQRFQHEAKAISQLEHPNIIKVHAFTASEVGVYLVMDYLEGISLAEIIEEEKSMPAKRALPIFRQAAAALDHAHSRGIIHRDLKPSNIMLVHDHETGRDEFVKLVDFGIAKLMPHEGEVVQKLTRAGAVFGTPAYMSPEQCTGKPLDARSDIYAFGCVMFEIITGNPPLEGESALATMYLQLQEEAPLLSDALAGRETSLELERIIDKCLEKEPDNRFQSMAEVLSALEEAAGHQTTVTKLPSQAPKKRHSKADNRRVWVISLAVVAVLFAGTCFLGREYFESNFVQATLSLGPPTLEQQLSAERDLARIKLSAKNNAEGTYHLMNAADLVQQMNPASQQAFDAWVEAGGAAEKSPGLEEGAANAYAKAIDIAAPSTGHPAPSGIDPTKVYDVGLKLAKFVYSQETLDPLTRFVNQYDRREPAKADLILTEIRYVPADKVQRSKLSMQRGRIRAQLNKVSDATRLFDESIGLSNRDLYTEQLNLNAGQNLHQAKLYSPALKYYTAGLKLARRNKNLMNEILFERRLGECLMLLGRYSEAIPHYKSVVDLWKRGNYNDDTDYVPSLDGLGNCYAYVGDFNNAANAFGEEINFFENRRSSFPQNQRLIALRGLGNALSKCGKYAEASAVFQRAGSRGSNVDLEQANKDMSLAKQNYLKANKQIADFAQVQRKYSLHR